MGVPAPIGVAAAGTPNAGDWATAYVGGTFAAIGPGDPFAFRGPMDLALWASLNVTLTTTGGSLAASVSAGTGIAAGQAVNSVNVPRGTTWGAFSGTTGTLALPALTFPVSGASISGPRITLPPGSNVNRLLGATVTVPSTKEKITLPANTTVVAVVQTDVAPTNTSPGVPGIVELSANPLTVSVTVSTPHLRFALTGNAVTTGVDTAAVFTGAGIVWTGTVQIETSWDGGATWIIGNIGTGTLAQFTAGTPINVRFGEPEKNVLYRLNCTAYTGVTSTALNYRISETGGANESLAIGPLISG